MSSEASAWAKIQKVGATGPKAALILLASVADQHGVTWRGVNYLADVLECHRTTVISHLATLQERGFIQRFERRRGDGAKSSSLILLAPNPDDRQTMRDPREHEHFGEFLRERLPWGNEAKVGISNVGIRSSLSRDSRPTLKDESTERVNSPPSEDICAPNPVLEVWEYWQAKRKGGSRFRLDKTRRRIISEALKVASTAECKAAIDGLFMSDYHVNKGFTDIRYALRGGGPSPLPDARIARFAALARGEISDDERNQAGADRYGWMTELLAEQDAKRNPQSEFDAEATFEEESDGLE